jgi:hypothetical protein
MSIYIQLLLVAAIVVFIVDLSGFIRAMLPKEGIYPDPEEIVGMAVLYAEELLKQVN